MAYLNTRRSIESSTPVDVPIWDTFEYEVDEPFTSGSLVITLPQTPISQNALFVFYNGQQKFPASPTEWSLSGADVTILFDDPYVLEPPNASNFFFQFQY
jgi:hypothetical protein